MKCILNKSKMVGYELDSNYDVKLVDFNKDILNYNNCEKLFLKDSCSLGHIKFSKRFIVKGNKIKYLSYIGKFNYKFIQLFIIFILSIILICISFLYTNYVLDLTMIFSYFSLLLFIMNFLIISLVMVLLFGLFKSVHISFIITRILILVLGVANQTKLLYRDDIVKFEDLILFKVNYYYVNDRR